ncbi:reverse transcriptase domain-containing protein [Tanacetum coccineum]
MRSWKWSYGPTYSSIWLFSPLRILAVLMKLVLPVEILGPQLKNEDFQQMDGDDLEDLRSLNGWWAIVRLLCATTVKEKGILLENADLEGIKGKVLMGPMAGAMAYKNDILITGSARVASRWKWISYKKTKNQAKSDNTGDNSFSSRRRRHHKSNKPSVDSSNLEKPIILPLSSPMDDNGTMAQLLEAPTEGYEDAIVIPEITANNFEIKHGLLNLVQNKQFFGKVLRRPTCSNIRYLNKITSTMKIPNVTNTSVKLMLFPFSLEGAARIWLEKEPPRSIETWDDLVMKFINKFFPPSKTTNLRNEITRFQQKFDETFCEAWDRFNVL